MDVTDYIVDSKEGRKFIRWGRVGRLTVGSVIMTIALAWTHLISTLSSTLSALIGGISSFQASLILSYLSIPIKMVRAVWQPATAFVASLGVLGIPLGFLIVIGVLVIWERAV
ncbi:hypothetical protein [Halosimplex amylolyticum]|uniref:hypothetical protein n=1 Tax=Halosimplex amylolyticum TaxID=3396616 RepID=UPI003F55AFDB